MSKKDNEDKKRRELKKKAHEAKQRKLHGYCAKQPDEVSPYIGMDADEALKGNAVALDLLWRIRRQKNMGKRPRPSDNLVIIPSAEDHDFRPSLLNKVAELVDKNAFGRNEMCSQFAVLLVRALETLGIEAKAFHGEVQYCTDTGEWKKWPDHAWVVTADGGLIDGNIDSVRENPIMGKGLAPASYWGPRENCPGDRKFPRGTLLSLREADVRDVDLWWNELSLWLKTRPESKASVTVGNPIQPTQPQGVPQRDRA